jgi:hypothetical protein
MEIRANMEEGWKEITKTGSPFVPCMLFSTSFYKNPKIIDTEKNYIYCIPNCEVVNAKFSIE